MTSATESGGVPVVDHSRHGPSADDRTRALALINRQPKQHADASIVDWLTRLCRALAVDLGVKGAAVTLSATVGDGEAVAAASSSDSRAAAGVGFTVGEGPAADALLSGRPVLVPHLGGQLYSAWPGYTAAARALGLRAIFCFPIQVGAVRFGVLSVFADVPTSLSAQDLSRCMTMTELATERLLDSSDGGHRDRFEPDLESALGIDSEIFQAQGMVAVALRVTLAQALARMRGHAFRSDRQLLEVAVDILEGRLDLPDDRPPT